MNPSSVINHEVLELNTSHLLVFSQRLEPLAAQCHSKPGILVLPEAGGLEQARGPELLGAFEDFNHGDGFESMISTCFWGVMMSFKYRL